MKKHTIISLVLIALYIIVPLVANAAIFVNKTSSFGGKVILTTIPGIGCVGFGKGPIVLSSSLQSLGSAIYSGVDGSQPTANRVVGAAAGLYGAIPFYASEISITENSAGGLLVSKPPSVGQWILGRANVIPEFSTCAIGYPPDGIPFPVRDTSNYRTSNSPAIMNPGSALLHN